MLDIETIKGQVQQNCDISDAKHAGLFSVCGLALRLRDLYKWDHGLNPWVEEEAEKVLEWIGDRETLWDSLADKPYERLHLQDATYDAFDTVAINRILGPHGLFYGAGFGRSLKPTFLLSSIIQEQIIGGYRVLKLGEEMARDLFSTPAFVQDGCVVVRMQAAGSFLWDSILYVNKSGKAALSAALKNHGIAHYSPQVLKDRLDHIAKIEAEVYVHHELGELQENSFDQDIWREIIAAYPHTPIELLARTLKDILADTNPHGTFQFILKKRKLSSLAFYVAFMEGLTKKLFSVMTDAFEAFLETENWSVIETAVAAGYDTAKNQADTMVRIFKAGRQKNDLQWAEKEITRRLLKPLGL